jgi:hypothetical protein
MAYLISRTAPCHFSGFPPQPHFYTGKWRNGYGVFTPRAIFVRYVLTHAFQSADLKIKCGKDLVTLGPSFLRRLAATSLVRPFDAVFSAGFAGALGDATAAILSTLMERFQSFYSSCENMTIV